MALTTWRHPIVPQTGSEPVLRRMLELTQPNRKWQDHFLSMLEQYILEADFRKALDFVQHVLHHAMKAFQEKQALVIFDPQLAPRLFHVGHWKLFLICLGFEVEEPDGFHKLEHVTLLLGAGVMMAALEGMLLLVWVLKALDWSLVRLLFRLSRDEASCLLALMEEDAESSTPSTTGKDLLSRYPDEMKMLGLALKHKQLIKNPGQAGGQFALALLALFHDTSDGIGMFI